MSHQVNCPDCNSGKISLHGFGYEAQNINPLQCMDCGLVFRAKQAIVTPQADGNLRRLIYMMGQFSRAKACYLLGQLTGQGKKEGKELLENTTLNDIKTSG
ncbi:hypothetical protein [Microscilla marina]|nr:hypothetical protein [Microscilla marina]